VLFLYLPTGGGHLAPARALAGRIAAEYGADTRIECPVKSRVGLFCYEDGYRIASQKLPALWRFMYANNVTPAAMRLSQFITAVFSLRAMTRLLDEYRPTRVVCVHHMLAWSLRQALRGRRRIPTIMVVTDPYDPHPIWAFNHRWPLACYTEEAAKVLVGYGADPRRVYSHSLIVNERFERPVSPSEIADYRRSLGLREGKPMVLIAGGADGMKRASQMTRELLSSRLAFDLVVVCGRDAMLKLEVETVALAHRIKAIDKKKVVVLGFTDSMPMLMRSADAIASKAGASVVAEVLCVGKPNIIAYRIPGQEEGNVDFVVKHGVGLYCRTPRMLKRGVESILGDAGRRESIERNIREMGFRNGLYGIAETIMTVAP
jgi:processive 1,2-diacylglycerol beta-glucosyltransferase/1,2-diacylglycerol 3-beta-galactosyltransferase